MKTGISQSDTRPLSLLGRRDFLQGVAASALAATLSQAGPAHAAAASGGDRVPICAFIKFLQSLSYEEMASRVADIGFDGIESTVRANGHVLPERVKDDLPRQIEALQQHGLDMTIMTTDVVRADDPHTEDVLRTGAELGVKLYRMGFYRYDPQRGVMDQLNEIAPQIRDLAAMNQELGLTAVYQNHSGANFVGAPLWDLQYLLQGIPKEQVGVAFDIRHATIEGGLAWPLHYDIMKPHIGAIFMKDYEWSGPKAEHMPLGEGRVDKSFLKTHQESGIKCPISLHVEYLKKGSADENTDALRRDYGVLCSWLGR